MLKAPAPLWNRTCQPEPKFAKSFVLRSRVVPANCSLFCASVGPVPPQLLASLQLPELVLPPFQVNALPAAKACCAPAQNMPTASGRKILEVDFIDLRFLEP